MNIIVQKRGRTKEKILDATMNPIRRLLPAALIEQWCRELNYSWRERVLGPVVTVLACVWKHMQSKVASAREVEDAISEWDRDCSGKTRSGSDFCQARGRLPLAVLQRAVEHVGALASKTAGMLFRSLPVWLVDGSTLRTPNTAELDAHFGRSRNGVRASRSPLARLLVLICAGSGAVLSVLTGSYVTSELALFIQLLESLPAGGLIVADRAYSSFLLCCLIVRRGSHLLARLRADRLNTKVKRLGYRDTLVEWTRPYCRNSARPELLMTCPEKMLVRVIERQVVRRGYRTWTLRIVTTLLDPKIYPANELAELYFRRWRIETALRTLKTHYQMAQLKGKTPGIVDKEIRSAMLAYNCVVALMGESGEAPELISAVRARDIVIRYHGYMAFMSQRLRREFYKEMLQKIATALQLPQERGPEPRAVIQRPGTFPVLMMTRAEWKKKKKAA